MAKKNRLEIRRKIALTVQLTFMCGTDIANEIKRLAGVSGRSEADIIRQVLYDVLLNKKIN